MRHIILLILCSSFWLITSAQILDESYKHKSIGLEKLESKDYSAAIVEFSKSIELCKPEYKYDMLETYHLRAHCKSMLEDYRGAITDYEKIIALCKEWDFKTDEVWSTAYYFKGLCEYQLSKTEDACRDWSQAGEMGYSKAYELIKQYCNN